jgi:hypothetical protein
MIELSGRLASQEHDKQITGPGISDVHSCTHGVHPVVFQSHGHLTGRRGRRPADRPPRPI